MAETKTVEQKKFISVLDATDYEKLKQLCENFKVQVEVKATDTPEQTRKAKENIERVKAENPNAKVGFTTFITKEQSLDASMGLDKIPVSEMGDDYVIRISQAASETQMAGFDNLLYTEEELKTLQTNLSGLEIETGKKPNILFSKKYTEGYEAFEAQEAQDQEYDLDQMVESSGIMNQWVAEIKAKGDLSPLEKYTLAYEKVTQFQYKYYGKRENSTITKSPVSVLAGHKNEATGETERFITCAGFSNVLCELCKRLGIPCYLTTEMVGNNEIFEGKKEPDKHMIGHVVCVVKMDDEKYDTHGIFVANPTWDAATEKGGSRMTYMLQNPEVAWGTQILHENQKAVRKLRNSQIDIQKEGVEDKTGGILDYTSHDYHGHRDIDNPNPVIYLDENGNFDVSKYSPEEQTMMTPEILMKAMKVAGVEKTVDTVVAKQVNGENLTIKEKWIAAQRELQPQARMVKTAQKHAEKNYETRSASYVSSSGKVEYVDPEEPEIKEYREKVELEVENRIEEAMEREKIEKEKATGEKIEEVSSSK